MSSLTHPSLKGHVGRSGDQTPEMESLEKIRVSLILESTVWQQRMSTVKLCLGRTRFEFVKRRKTPLMIDRGARRARRVFRPSPGSGPQLQGRLNAGAVQAISLNNVNEA